MLDASDIDTARELIISYIRVRDERVFYFHGWSGIGASAVLRSVAKVLPSRKTIPELCFERIIFIDCSEWKGRRSMQRAIAEELKLDSSTMAILDKKDKDDDFHGVDEISRDEIFSVSRKINHNLKDGRFVMIFCNGSDTEIDLFDSGVPPFDKFSNNVLLWSYGKRQLTIQELEKYKAVEKLRFTHILVYESARYLKDDELYALLCKEATIIAVGMDPTMVADYWLYKLFMHASFPTTTKYNWAGHASNCWICDGILHLNENISRDLCNVLSREMRLDCDDSLVDYVLQRFKTSVSVVKSDGVYDKQPYRWISIISKDIKLHGIQIIPAQTSTFILNFDRAEPPLALPNGLFERSSILAVLILCCCAFNFASPPFIKCPSLKFLGLEHCTDKKTCEEEDHTEWACLYRLRVLSLCSTYWNEILSEEKVDLMTNITELNIDGSMCWQYINCLQGRLPNLERLRIMNPTCEHTISTETSNSFLNKTKLEILDFSGNSNMEILPSSLSKVSSLRVLVLDGCTKLEDVVPDVLPHLLRSFRLDAFGPPTVEQHISLSTIEDKDRAKNLSKISLKGCTRLDNLFLRGLPNLVELDLSGSAIKVLDFKTMVVEVPRLKRIFLLGCEHLRAIIWGMTQTKLELLCIDTRAGSVHACPSLGQNKRIGLHVHAVVEDARLGWSLFQLIHPRNVDDVYFNINVTSSPVHNGSIELKAICHVKTDMYAHDEVIMQRSFPASQYIDVLSMVSNAQMQAFPDPPTTNLDRNIEIGEGSTGLESILDNFYDLSYIMKHYAESLHVHDASNCCGMPMGVWTMPKVCRMERCPKLDTVFNSSSSGFHRLETFWALNLLMARQIWSKYSICPRNKTRSFRYLQHLHVSSCPRLQFVLPVWISSFPNLETLHLIHCGELKHIFVLDREYPEEITTNGVAFPKLTTIHLHDLPTLRQICKVKMVAPKLESIKIRGCFGLRRLPVVEDRGPGMKKPTIEIEKDIWDALEWDGAEASHHPSHFEAPVHSRYYKKKLPRTSVIR